jgi:hypothetical protein
MLCLPQARIDKPLPIKQANVAKTCIQMMPFETMVEKEGQKASQLKGKYAAKMLALLQVIWLKRSRGTYVNQKLMLLVAMAEQG